MTEDKGKKLDGWAEIEEFLGVTRKTITNRGYLIRYYPTGRPFAFTSELLAYEQSLGGRPAHSQELPRSSRN